MQALIDAAVKARGNSVGAQMAKLENVRDAQSDPKMLDLIESNDLSVVLIGTGSPLIQPDRVGPCTAILGGGHFFLVDCGPAAFRVIRFLGLPVGRLNGVILTHFHSDHIGDLGETMTFSWIGGNSKLPVYGPVGVKQVVEGFEEAYSLDQVYRTAHHGADLVHPDNHGFVTNIVQPVPEGKDNVIVYNDPTSGFMIKGFEVDHKPVKPAYGYRFELNGRAVVISGDTCKCDSLIRNAKHCDLLVQEAICCEIIGKMARIFKDLNHPIPNRQAKFLHDILDYHTPVQDGLDVAAEAGVKELVFSHLVPTPVNTLLEQSFFAWAKKSSSWNGNVTIGADGMIFRINKTGGAELMSTGLLKRWNPYRVLGQAGTLLAGLLYYFARSNSTSKPFSMLAGAIGVLTWFRSRPDFVARM